MSTTPAGTADIIAARILVDGATTASAATAKAKIQRASDGLWLNTTAGTWGAFSAGTGYFTLVADADDDARYAHTWTTPATPDVYAVTIEVSAPFVASLTGEIDTRAIAHVEAVTTAARTALSTAIDGIATTLASGVTVAAIAADVITGTSIASTAVAEIAAGVRDLAEGTPSAGTLGYGWQLLRMLATNIITETAGNPGSAVLLKDDGVTTHKTWSLRDGTGGAVTATTGEPARRGAAT